MDSLKASNKQVDILNDLRDRFQGIHKQHEVILEQSMNILQEIAQASITKFEARASPKIRALIREFEPVPVIGLRSPGLFIPMKKNVDVKMVLNNSEYYNRFYVLDECLYFCKRAKDSLDKVERYIDKLCPEKTNSYSSNFSSCVSSCHSLKHFRSVEDYISSARKNGGIDVGYQGDIDDESEDDIHKDTVQLTPTPN